MVYDDTTVHDLGRNDQKNSLAGSRVRVSMRNQLQQHPLSCAHKVASTSEKNWALAFYTSVKSQLADKNHAIPTIRRAGGRSLRIGIAEMIGGQRGAKRRSGARVLQIHSIMIAEQVQKLLLFYTYVIITL
jgi:hypothetical protein